MRSIWITMQNVASKEREWLSVDIAFGMMFHACVRPDFRFGQRAKILRTYPNGNVIGDDCAAYYTTDLVVGEDLE